MRGGAVLGVALDLDVEPAGKDRRQPLRQARGLEMHVVGGDERQVEIVGECDQLRLGRGLDRR
ncbi:hypothetical protein CNY89_27590, partial [Amaricoccus sp. HAR-UPW-R2A-40]